MCLYHRPLCSNTCCPPQHRISTPHETHTPFPPTPPQQTQEPNEPELEEFLINQLGFNPDRVKSGIAKLKARFHLPSLVCISPDRLTD